MVRTKTLSSPARFITWRIFTERLRFVTSVMARRDRKKKRFVHDAGKEEKNKKIKTESGQVVSSKRKKKNLYPFIVFYCATLQTHQQVSV